MSELLNVNVGIVSGVERFGTYVPIQVPETDRLTIRICIRNGNERRFGDSTMVFDKLLFIGFHVVCDPHVVQIL
jgi:hypothetical protein